MTGGAGGAAVLPDGVAQLCDALGPRLHPLLPALGRLDWVTALPGAAAPGFVFLAGTCGGQPVGGGGADLVEAAVKLAGETAEVLAQEAASPAADVAAHPALGAIWGDGPCLPAIDLTTMRLTGAPLAAFKSGRPAHEAPPSGLGLAAGPDRDAARLAALLELIERDAVARWWAGETRGRAVDPAASAPVGTQLARMREGATTRRPTGLMLLPSVAGVPVAVAMSHDVSGRGLAFGFKASPNLLVALRGAAFEMMQMEIGLEIARLRAARGQSTQADAAPLARAALDPDGYPAFAALPPDGIPPQPGSGDLAGLAARLSGAGIEVIMADLSTPSGGPVVSRALAPGLRPAPGPGPRPQPGAPGEIVDVM